MKCDKPSKKVLLVDDHPIVTEALAAGLRTFCVFEVIDVDTSLGGAISRLTDDGRYDLVMLDLNLTDTSGTDTLLGLREQFPDIPVIIFSGECDPRTIQSAFENGARGYISKKSSIEEILSAIRTVLSGRCFIPQQLIKTQDQQPIVEFDSNPVNQLSQRQIQVLHYLLQGMPNKIIAHRLNMAEGTVKAHLNTVYRVFNANNRSQVIIKANSLGIL
ncbi:MAG: DNA-binding response regulator [Alcanivorax sp.]|jgi:DNA-binding NarL/FixJ family response regulator|nr:MAG: DNA-binding response regulator [Alcanivorax sp.]